MRRSDINRRISAYNHYSYPNGRNIDGIVIHYVGAVSTAKNNADYFFNGNRDASAHYFVDRNEVWQSVEDNDAAWHCGGGAYSQGYGGSSWGSYLGNRNTIGIEMCCEWISGTCCVPYETIVKTGELVRMLMQEYGIPAQRVVRHYDITGKDCPEWLQLDGRPQRGTSEAAWEKAWEVLVFGADASHDPGTESEDPVEQEADEPANSEHFGGTYACMVNGLRVRTKPGLDGTPVAYYNAGETVELDDRYTIRDGYVWGQYTARSGNVRYIAVGRATGKVEDDDYLIKL